MRIVVDRDKCTGLGMCEAEAPDLFEVQDDGSLLVLLDCPGSTARDAARPPGRDPVAAAPPGEDQHARISSTMWCALTRLGVIGHRDLSEESQPIIEAALRRLLVAKGGSRLVGVTCLAPGADQLFAQTVLNLDGRLEVILP